MVASFPDLYGVELLEIALLLIVGIKILEHVCLEETVMVRRSKRLGIY